MADTAVYCSTWLAEEDGRCPYCQILLVSHGHAGRNALGLQGYLSWCSDHREGDCHVSVERTGGIFRRQCLQGCCCELLGKVEDSHSGVPATAFLLDLTGRPSLSSTVSLYLTLCYLHMHACHCQSLGARRPQCENLLQTGLGVVAMCPEFLTLCRWSQ